MAPFLTRLCRLEETLASPPSRNFWLTSLRSTRMPARASAVQMPLPMSPPPITPTHLRGLGARPWSVTPRTFEVDRWARKMCTSALDTSDMTQCWNTSCSFLRPAAPPCSTPAWTASMHMCGCSRWPAVFLACARAPWMIICAVPRSSSLSVRRSELLRATRPAAMSSASFRDSARRALPSTTPSMRPLSRASLALMGLDVSIISRLFFRPMRRGRRCVPPNPGMIPRLSSGRPNTVWGRESLELHIMATSRPPPRADPEIAATVGLGPLSSASGGPTGDGESPLWIFWNVGMSKPALKFFPPVTTMALTSGLELARSIHECSPWSTSGWRAFTGGLERVITATPSCPTSRLQPRRDMSMGSWLAGEVPGR
mmetsp:Transcript_59603/g.189665  ORF Transcript_59603/g.189665 Transcript_59603/m.189665 type:complete len:371 (+) Transcript_59603:1278-2390(+)